MIEAFFQKFYKQINVTKDNMSLRKWDDGSLFQSGIILRKLLK